MPSKEASMYQNRSSRCFSCPTCATALSTAFQESNQQYFFLCAHCRWDSLELGLVDDDPDALIMMAITRERQAVHEDMYQALHSHFTMLSGSLVDVKIAGVMSSNSGTTFGRSTSLQMLADSMKNIQREHRMKKFKLQRLAEMGGWKYDQALEKEQERTEWLMQQSREHQWPELKRQLAELQALGTVWDETSPKKTREMLEIFSQRCDMGPLLRAKRAWRCVESIKRGTAGILVKPQISPMSGDSSLPVSSSWFKKANLATHYVPIVTFQRLPYHTGNAGCYECILLIENPLDDAIRITFRPATFEADEGIFLNGQAVLQDSTPIIIGPYEDPNLADAFIDEKRTVDAYGNKNNEMLLQSTRNLIKIKFPLVVKPASSNFSISALFIMDTEKFDEDANEVIEKSRLSVPVVITAPIPQ
ncbi:Dynactin, subunit p62 [Plasmopara halstedii]|uniref:Dynactin subunit 4 n=1 Tax=Plasmopara halstedii TaxID=4781 RepID=A0A0P1AI39_PLAHL|nr:Dynactin, subunit p62 [Plasmopara halstedii]CEG40848.1 Dynactin, subunit p62 [Plasmopara halstedii]|eukprot:XP_024577217.1 Dynactin, subunit p62 [Plasmopara halstedii]